MHIGKYTIIDEPIEIADDVWIGNFVHIRPGVKIGSGSEIRDYVFLDPSVTIGKNTRVRNFCHITMGAVIGNNCFIGVGTYTANDKAITWPEKDYSKNQYHGFDLNPPIIEDNVRVGVGVKILPGVVLRKGCRIGMGAVVTKSTKPYRTYVGNPAREL